MEDAHQQIEKLIAADKVEAALSEFRDALAGSDAEVEQELIQHQAALAKVTKERRRGLIDVSREEQTRNRVRYALLDLLGEWFAQVSLRPRERFWDIPVPKIDSAFDSLFVPRPSRSLALR
ncbi:MAG: hypothetical protein JMN26_14605, partial [gamma proteobacterium endosymbiont of Lamellibrachia anaximandri]|nr:hypothetical protein [gamma proteobacterium endosymbiont of Lamellibrachia anaximandri]